MNWTVRWRPVAVRSRFDGSWASGFEIAESILDGDRVIGYLVRRPADGAVLPVSFGVEDVRPATELRRRLDA